MVVTDGWSWHAALDGSGTVETAEDVDLRVVGEHEYRRIAGSGAWVPRDTRATVAVPFDGWSDRRSGTLSAWVSPLEDVGPRMHLDTHVEGENGHARLPVFSDAYRRENQSESALALTIYPGPRVGLCARGIVRGPGYLPKHVDSGRPVIEPADPASEVTQARLFLAAFPMEPGKWYHVAMGWDVDEGCLDMYANGNLIKTGRDRGFHLPGATLYVGNPLLALADVRASDERLPPDAVAAAFDRERRRHDRPLDDGTADAIDGVEYGPLDVDREQYVVRREYDLTDPDEVDQWVQHGPDSSVLPACTATPEGLLFETSDGWEYQDCATLWAPGRFDGDVLVECEFRIERPDGLALLIFDASTFERGDVIDDRNYEVTGQMGPLISDIRSYWWEFFRRTPPNRGVDSHILLKGAYGFPPLDENVSPLPETDTWHTLTINKEGDLIRGAIDGETIVRADESSFPANGPSLNCGRIGIRHMQQTRIRYRNLRVATRTPPYLDTLGNQ